MAKIFSEKQREIIARKLGYEGPMAGFEEFVKSDPAMELKVRSLLTKYMATGGFAKRFAEGGAVDIEKLYQDVLGRSADTAGKQFWEAYAADPTKAANLESAFKLAAIDELKAKAKQPGPPKPEAPTMEVAQIQYDPTQSIAEGTGQAPATTRTAAPTTAAAQTAAAPTPVVAQTYTPVQAAPAVLQTLAGVEAQQGVVSPEAQVKAVVADPRTTALMQTQAAQGVAEKIEAPAARAVQEGEMVTGPTVDQARVEEALAQTQAQAAQGEVTPEMTLQGQLGKMLADFDAGNPPTWAAATMRAATAQLAARGLGASSLAGQAVVQAALEAATPIAAADAQVFQQMGLQNLSNRQQMAVLTAQQRAQFLGQEFDQAFQTKVLNAAKIADIANMNFNADVQIAMENARIAQTMNLANLSNKQAVVMAQAAQIANLETQNLSNMQQAAVVNAQAFLQMDMANLSNRQQTMLFKTQEMNQALLSDAASANAALQFNASSQNQIGQFNASLVSDVQRFNAQQQNAIAQFNADAANTIAQFNAQQQNARDQFNAQNSLIVAQSNAEWRRQIATANTAAQNVANQFNAQSALQLTTTQYSNQWQTYRDTLQYAHTSAENDLDRENRLALQTLQADAAKYAADREIKASMYKALGNLGASILSGAGGAGVVGKFVDGASNVIVSGINAVSKYLSGGSSDVTEIFPEDAEFGVRYFSNGVYFDTNTNTYYDSTGNVQWQPLEDELIEFTFDEEGGGEGP